MNTLYHAVINAVLAIILYYLFPHLFTISSFLIIVLAGVVIDFDHLAYYALRGGNPKRDFKRKNPHFYVFHTIEFVILLGILSIFSQTFVFILIGMVAHLITDIATYMYYGKYSWLPYWSAIYHLLLKR